jgi:hypothetical protein
MARIALRCMGRGCWALAVWGSIANACGRLRESAVLTALRGVFATPLGHVIEITTYIDPSPELKRRRRPPMLMRAADA